MSSEDRPDADAAHLAALLEEERAIFRSELVLGAAELARRDHDVRTLQARCEELTTRCEELVAARDQLAEHRRRLRRRRVRLVAQRDRARAELEKYQSSRLIRLTARVVWRVHRRRA